MIKKIALIGMMGSGKSEIGKRLAGVLDFKYFDLDEEFEKDHGSIKEFFKMHGEESFRKIESNLLKKSLTHKNVIVSTGGGIVEKEENRKILSSVRTFYLKVPLPILWKRVKGSGRPLAKDEENFTDLFARRRDFYEDFESVNVENLKIWEATAKIAKEIIDLSTIAELHDFQNVRISTNFTLPKTNVRIIANKIKKIWEINGFGVEDGEGFKDIEKIKELWEFFSKLNVDRSSKLCAVGGGTTTDAVGFASLTFMRGVPFDLVPTTLLGMVDASIGGKFAINFKGAKNQIGSFGRPNVYVNPLFSLSLSDDVFKEGIVESLKLGAVYDKKLFEYIEMNVEKILKRNVECLNKMISLSVKDKLEICKIDPFDKGIRHILNFGHTIAHAIESESNNNISHGHAVAIGMMSESQRFSPRVFERIKNIIERLDFDDVKLHNPGKWIETDKKRQGESIRIPIVDEIGKSHIEKVKISEFLKFL